MTVAMKNHASVKTIHKILQWAYNSTIFPETDRHGQLWRSTLFPYKSYEMESSYCRGPNKMHQGKIYHYFLKWGGCF